MTNKKRLHNITALTVFLRKIQKQKRDKKVCMFKTKRYKIKEYKIINFELDDKRQKKDKGINIFEVIQKKPERD